MGLILKEICSGGKRRKQLNIIQNQTYICNRRIVGGDCRWEAQEIEGKLG